METQLISIVVSLLCGLAGIFVGIVILLFLLLVVFPLLEEFLF